MVALCWLSYDPTLTLRKDTVQQPQFRPTAEMIDARAFEA
jgi:hypothetical protein